MSTNIEISVKARKERYDSMAINVALLTSIPRSQRVTEHILV